MITESDDVEHTSIVHESHLRCGRGVNRTFTFFAFVLLRQDEVVPQYQESLYSQFLSRIMLAIFSAMSFFSHKKPELEAVTETMMENTEHPLAEIVRFSLIAILIVFPIRLFVAQPFIVSGASMETTFHSGEYLIVDQLSYYFRQPARGEVIVFKYPRDPSKYFIKRVVGEPGDTVTIENGIVSITNKANPDGFDLKEPYAEPTPLAPKMVEKLGEREYFVMGDNRDESSDSRTWGVLQQEKIVGRAWVRLFPPGVTSYLPGTANPGIIRKTK